MSNQAATWKERNRPARLERRIVFEDYEQTRDFLEALADISEAANRYPDISFGRTSVSLTIQTDEDSGAILPEHRAFARQIDALITAVPAAS
ncbi:4a-hydroxytetrahydrobiopterin dehydratase [Thiorhodococcus fuscus]|uniref:4a-hydroxytetrahydrobiopterin dehydratase n=1 Tax=Thiorhodococcus fuscus TaxID=527200 RepID=A0ABW4Y4S0_9GAMM